jgi:multimeric flavodoxin WrbA
MTKKLVLHDLLSHQIEALLAGTTGEHTIFSSLPTVRHCEGCFGCWVKTPGVCVIDDRCKGLTVVIPEHSHLLVISRMVFGSLSPDVKAVLERCIGYLMPFFRIVDGEMHHTLRYDHSLDIHYIFYGPNIMEREKETARRLVAANALNLGAKNSSASFYQSIDEIEVAL